MQTAQGSISEINGRSTASHSSGQARQGRQPSSRGGAGAKSKKVKRWGTMDEPRPSASRHTDFAQCKARYLLTPRRRLAARCIAVKKIHGWIFFLSASHAASVPSRFFLPHFRLCLDGGKALPACLPGWLRYTHCTCPLTTPCPSIRAFHLTSGSGQPVPPGRYPSDPPITTTPSTYVCCPGADLAVHRSACSAPQRIALNGSPSPTPTWASWATPPAPPHHHLSQTEVVAGRRPSVGCPVLRCPPVAVARCAPPELECAGAHTGRHAAFPFTAGS